MTLNTSHVVGDTGHVADHNAIAAILNGMGTPLALEGTNAPPDTNTTGGVKGTAGTAAHSDHTHRLGDHDHTATGKGAKINPTTALTSTGTPSSTTFLRGDNSWAAVTKTVRISHTWAISGTLGVASGATNYIPPFYLPVPSGQTATIVAVRTKVRAGTVTANITKNGTSITGLSTVSVTTTAATTSATGGNTGANDDEIGLTLSSPSGADGLTVTVYIDITV